MMGGLDFGSVTLLLAGLVVASLGGGVYLQSRARRENRLFFLFSISASVWMLTNALFTVAAGTAQYVIGLISYAAAVLLSLFFLLFSASVSNASRKINEKTLIIIGALIAAISATPGVIGTGISSSGAAMQANSFALMLYGLVVAATLVASIAILVKRLVIAKNKRERSALIFVLAGLVAGVLVGLVFNLILPLSGNYQFIQLGPLGVLCLALTSAYAIARYGLFDIRIATVRSVGYIVTLAALVAVYFITAYIISFLFMQQINVGDASSVLMNIVTALILALVFQPIKSFFDSMVESVFYQSRYNTDTLITELGNALVSSTVLRTILERASAVIQRGLHASYVTFVVRREGRRDVVVTAGRAVKLSLNELQKLGQSFIGEDLEITDVNAHYDIHGTATDVRCSACGMLRRKHCALVLPLANGVGYVLIGDRLGGAYSERDKRVLRAISNELQIAIQNARSVEEVRRLNATLQQRIDSATRELRASNEKLKKLDATKDEFVSMASHQLRTPLTSVKGYISMLLEGDAGKITEQQRALLGEAFTSSERMVRLISDFLNVSRLQTGKFTIDAHATDLARVIGDEIDAVRGIAESHGQQLHYSGPETLPDVMIDEDKTRQVIMNFIDNAIYYSPEGSIITVKLRASRGQVVFEVHDRGIGVPRAEQDQLFTKFFRAENARRQRPDGTGVGLFLAKKVIEAQKGEIIFHSRSGMGSVFGFRLPLHK